MSRQPTLADREYAQDVLASAVRSGLLTLSEFDSLVTVVWNSEDHDEISALLFPYRGDADLSATAPPQAPPTLHTSPPGSSVVDSLRAFASTLVEGMRVPDVNHASSLVPTTHSSLAILGSKSLKGSWISGRVLSVFGLMGENTLDFREAFTTSQDVHIRVFNTMGSTRIIVPPGVFVSMNVLTIMGSDTIRDTTPAFPGAPTLHITGVNIMSSVVVHVKPLNKKKKFRRR